MAEVAFQGWTGDGMLRRASFVGLRAGGGGPLEAEPEAAPPGRPRPAPAADGPLVLAGVRISHPERPVLDDPPLAKGDLARYVAAAAELILPHVAGRPLSVVRCPDRLGEGCFFQRHPMAGMPGSVRAVSSDEAGRKPPYLAVDDAAGLLALVQLDAVELDPSGARADRPDRPDRLILDLDPGPEVAWAAVVAAALGARDRLARLGLRVFRKTTGGKGLHVVVPIERRHGWPAAKASARALAEAMAADSPRRYTTTLAKATRTGRIFLDHLRNDRAATAVAPSARSGLEPVGGGRAAARARAAAPPSPGSQGARWGRRSNPNRALAPACHVPAEGDDRSAVGRAGGYAAQLGLELGPGGRSGRARASRRAGGGGRSRKHPAAP